MVMWLSATRHQLLWHVLSVDPDTTDRVSPDVLHELIDVIGITHHSTTLRMRYPKTIAATQSAVSVSVFMIYSTGLTGRPLLPVLGCSGLTLLGTGFMAG